MVDTDQIFKEIVGQATSPGITDMSAQMKQIQAIISAMDDGIMRLSQAMQTIGQGLDVCHFKIHMVLEILLDKGIVTREELDGHYKQLVADKIAEMQRLQEEKMREAIAQTEQNAGIKTRTQQPEPEPEKEPEYDGDVVLASERSETVRFK